MQKIFIIVYLSSFVLLSGCFNTSSQTVSDDENSYTPEILEDTTKPTVYTEIPTTTNDEIITQADTSL